MSEPRRLTTLLASTASYRDSFTFLFLSRPGGTEQNHEIPHAWQCACPGREHWRKYKSEALVLEPNAVSRAYRANMTTNSQEVNTFRSISTGCVCNNHNSRGITGHANLLTFVVCFMWTNSRPPCNRWRVSGPIVNNFIVRRYASFSVTRSNVINDNGTQFCWVVSVI
jgi:hypothetical protein